MDDKKAFEKYEDPGDDSELTATQQRAFQDHRCMV